MVKAAPLTVRAGDRVPAEQSLYENTTRPISRLSHVDLAHPDGGARLAAEVLIGRAAGGRLAGLLKRWRAGCAPGGS